MGTGIAREFQEGLKRFIELIREVTEISELLL
jgi:hypothetical protein